MPCKAGRGGRPNTIFLLQSTSWTLKRTMKLSPHCNSGDLGQEAVSPWSCRLPHPVMRSGLLRRAKHGHNSTDLSMSLFPWVSLSKWFTFFSWFRKQTESIVFISWVVFNIMEMESRKYHRFH